MYFRNFTEGEVTAAQRWHVVQGRVHQDHHQHGPGPQGGVLEEEKERIVWRSLSRRYTVLQVLIPYSRLKHCRVIHYFMFSSTRFRNSCSIRQNVLYRNVSTLSPILTVKNIYKNPWWRICSPMRVHRKKKSFRLTPRFPPSLRYRSAPTFFMHYVGVKLYDPPIPHSFRLRNSEMFTKHTTIFANSQHANYTAKTILTRQLLLFTLGPNDSTQSASTLALLMFLITAI